MADDLFTLFTARLAAAGIEPVVTGGVAAMIYGQPRVVEDIDLLVHLQPDEVEAITQAFPEEDFVCPPVELLRIEAERPTRGHFALIHRETGLWADVFVVGADPRHRWALTKAREVVVRAITLRIAPPEYVIARKLERLREHEGSSHLDDIRQILLHHGDHLDHGELAAQIVAHGLQPQWNRVTKSLQSDEGS